MPQVRMLTSVAGDELTADEGEVVEMSPQMATVWADGVRGEVVRPSVGVETPEGNVTARRGGFDTPETRVTRRR